MAKKILFVDNSTRCFCIFRLAVAKAFVNLGYDVYVASPEPYDIYILLINESGITHIPYMISPNNDIIEDLRLIFKFRKIYKELRPDFIVHYTIKPNIFGTLAAQSLKINTLSVVPGTGSVFQKSGIISTIVGILYKFAFRFPKNVWVLNNDDLRVFLKKKIISKNRIEILSGEGVNVEFFSTTKEYKKNNPFVFLYMGRMLREKGVENLAEAARILRKKGIENFEVHLLGLTDGLSKDVINENEIISWQKDGLVKYMGSVQDVRNDIEKCDCVVLPSFYGEGIPRSLMEACAMKKVVLTTDNVGCRDIIRNQLNGILCKPNDLNDLALKMEYVMNLSEVRIKVMGEAGRKIVIEEFEESLIVDKYIKEIENHLKS